MIELNILRGNLQKCIEKGVEQTATYADKTGANQTYLVIFNRDQAVSWDDKIWRKQLAHATGLPVDCKAIDLDATRCHRPLFTQA